MAFSELRLYTTKACVAPAMNDGEACGGSQFRAARLLRPTSPFWLDWPSQSLWLKSASALESLLYAIGKFCIGQWGHFCTFGSSRFRFSSFENPLIFFQLWGMDQPFHEIVALSEKIKAINYPGKNTELQRERAVNR